MKRILWCGLIIVLALASATADAAIKGTALTVLAMDAQGNQYALHRVDLSSGETALVGATGRNLAGLAFDSRARLFAVDADTDELVELDSTTGESTVVGSLGADLQADASAGLSFDRDGRLWLLARLSDGAMGLFEVDPDTGASQWIGAVPGDYVGGLASNGLTLYAASQQLVVLDSETAATTAIGSDWALATFPPLHLAFGTDGTLWALTVCAICTGPSETLALRIIDPTAGIESANDAGFLPLARGFAIRPMQEVPGAGAAAALQ